MNRNIFFPEYEWMADPAAKATCRFCPVKDDCLEWALTTHQEFGIWGGLDEWQRANIDKIKNRVHCPDCRSTNVVEDGRHEVCISCGLSWAV